MSPFNSCVSDAMKHGYSSLQKSFDERAGRIMKSVESLRDACKRLLEHQSAIMLQRPKQEDIDGFSKAWEDMQKELGGF